MHEHDGLDFGWDVQVLRAVAMVFMVKDPLEFSKETLLLRL